MNQSVALNTLNAPLSPVVQLGPIDAVETALVDRWADVSQATYRFLALLREFDFRQGWKDYGCNDCAEWMDFKLKISRKTALEKVRVANALWFVPIIDAAFRDGALSYSQVRALTRIADETNEEDLVQRAQSNSAGALEKYVQRLRHGDEQVSEQLARSQHQGRALHVFVDSGELTVKLPPDQLAIVQQALEALVATLPDDPERDYFATRADALVQMATLTLEGTLAGTTASDEGASDQPSGPTVATTHAHKILVHVDAMALSGQGGESDYPLPTVKRLCCSGALTPIVKSGDQILNVGRKYRVVPPRLRQALAARDRQCQFPGCHHTQFLDAHHIKHWCDGGETNLDNLLLLCTHHHTAMHEGGFRLHRRVGGWAEGLYFTRPDGRLVEGPSSAEDPREDRDVNEPGTGFASGQCESTGGP